MMAKYVTRQYPLGMATCVKLGIDPNNVRKITTVSEVGTVETLTVEFYAPDGNEREFRKFELVERTGIRDALQRSMD